MFPAYAGMIRCYRHPKSPADEVFPAYAGMIRSIAYMRDTALSCVPRLRGDDPRSRVLDRQLKALVFPAYAGMIRRARRIRINPSAFVFPAYAGMIRFPSEIRQLWQCSPPTRG